MHVLIMCMRLIIIVTLCGFRYLTGADLGFQKGASFFSPTMGVASQIQRGVY